MIEKDDLYLRMQIALAEAARYALAFEIVPIDEKEYIKHLSASLFAVFKNIINTMDGDEQDIALVRCINEITRACYMFGYTRKTSSPIPSEANIIVSLN